MGLARHAGERVGVDRRLVRLVSVRFGNGSARSGGGLAPGGSGRRLARRREERSVCGSLQHLARQPLRQHRLPPGQDKVSLGAIAVLHSAAQRGKGVRRSAKAGARATEPSGWTPARRDASDSRREEEAIGSSLPHSPGPKSVRPLPQALIDSVTDTIRIDAMRA